MKTRVILSAAGSDRPGLTRSLAEAVLAALQTALDDLAANPAVRVLVLAAAGKAFCAGPT